MREKKELLEKPITAWVDVETWIRAITEIENYLQIHGTIASASDEFQYERQRLQEQFMEKKRAVGMLQAIHDSVELVKGKLVGSSRLAQLAELHAELHCLASQCLELSEPVLVPLRDGCREEILHSLCVSIEQTFSRAEQQIKEFSMADEAGLQLVSVKLKDGVSAGAVGEVGQH
ncbi:unnamed protein product [Gongylonema pulchrum]|uniref:Uncharacterized protein n=1 Tax=Gongylonema pulchrum TaxID=637853 RepID=A0A3P7PAH2_9BILA|nr:unnamed protein product [Gongylonema pulchrum]